MGGGKCEKITITNDKGRLSKDEIEKMVQDSEKFKEEDNKQKERVDAKNNLKSYCFNIKSTLEDNASQGKISEEDRGVILEKCNEMINWLDKNQSAETEEFKEKLGQLFKNYTLMDKTLKVSQLLEVVDLKVGKDLVEIIMEGPQWKKLIKII